jgi:release factor glutamine methyltransferase
MPDAAPCTVAQAMSMAQHALDTVRASDTSALDVRLIFCDALGLTTAQLLCRMNDPLPQKGREKIDALVRRRMDHEPMAYILGRRDFYGHTFLVDERVLIPRPDTETLVEAALTHIRAKQSFYRCTGGTWGDNLKILDVCTGSGCVGISLAAELPGCTITLSDISADALAVAKANANAILGQDLDYVQGNLLTPFIPVPLETQRKAYDTRLRENYQDGDYGYELSRPEPFSADTTRRFDVIVSNPPYLTDQWCDETEAQVHWEPRLALAGGDLDGLKLIRDLVEQSTEVLAQDGALLLECDYRQCNEVSDIMKQQGFYDISIENDLAGKPRVVWGIL